MGWIDPRFNLNCATKYLLFICQRFGNIHHFDPPTKFKTWIWGGFFLAIGWEVGKGERNGGAGGNWPGVTAQKGVRVCSLVVDFSRSCSPAILFPHVS